MTVVDANVLLYAVNRSAEHHDGSRRWLDGELNAGRPVGFAWVALLAFLRLSTKVGLFPSPLSVGAATAQVTAWLTHPAGVVVSPTPRHHTVLAGLVAAIGSGGNLVSDAHLAALSIEHDAAIVSYDTDFSRFDGVTWTRPATI